MSPTCPSCHMTNNAGATFCRHCGGQLSAPPVAAASYPPPPPPPQPSYGSYPPAPPQASYGSYPSAPPPPASWPGHPTAAPLPPPVTNSYQSVYQQPSYPPAPSYPPGAYAQPGAGYAYGQPVPASVVLRFVAMVVDNLPLMIVFPFTFIPIIGALVTLLIIVPYWLLRDVTGAGIGKRLMGLEVIQVDGTPPRQGPRILRNITIVAPNICLVVPGFGHLLFFLFSLIVYLGEIVLVLSGNRRLGDRLAGTMVVQKRR
jgi:uncharacterized RDD family membrane protein YckC